MFGCCTRYWYNEVVPDLDTPKIIKLGKKIVSVEGRLITSSGKIAASGLHTAVLTKTSDIDKSQ